MTECQQRSFGFARVCGRRVVADFEGGAISTDGGLLLLREVEGKTGLLRRAAGRLTEWRAAKGRVRHSLRSLFAQRVLAIAQGWEDLNDHRELRDDMLLQAACERTATLASPATLCRMENKAADRHSAKALGELLVEHFMASHPVAPQEIILDFDATDDPTHGQQEGSFFHGYYEHYCFMPLYVFCGSFPLVAWLRPGRCHAAKGALLALKFLVKRLRAKWPATRIIWRADSGFALPQLLEWSEENGLDYIVGMAKNTRNQALGQWRIDDARRGFERTGAKQRLFGWIDYQAGSWSRPRRLIIKAEHSAKGTNPRFVITTLKGNARELYDQLYCARGDMENRIKEQQLWLFADRTSAHRWWPNQLRLTMSTLAYCLVDWLRRKALAGTQLAKAQAGRIRLELLKIGAVITRNTRTLAVHLSASWPRREEFAQAHAILTAPG